MRNAPDIQYREDINNSLSTHQEYTERKSLSFQTHYAVNIVEERLLSFRINEIADELVQIMGFIKELGKFGYENTEVLIQMREILVKLRSRDRNYRYTKIVHVLTKYLNGMRGISSSTHTKGILFYKKLFESTLVVIMQELDSIDMEMC